MTLTTDVAELAAIDAAFPHGRWRARWVWADGAPTHGADRRAVALRRVVDLDAVPAAVPARVCADARYVLTVNGTEVARGPVRDNPRRRRHDLVDLAPHLRPGRNVVAALVTFYGNAVAWWMPGPTLMSRVSGGGFLFEARLGDDWLVSDEAWTATLLDGWTSRPGGPGLTGRATEVLDLRPLPAGWDDPDGDDPGWPAAAALSGATLGEPGRPEPPNNPLGPYGPRPLPYPTVDDVALRDVVAPNGDDVRLADRVVAGTIVADVDGPAGATVTFEVVEFADDDGTITADADAVVKAEVVLDGSRRHVETFDAYGLRAVRVVAGEGVAVDRVTVRERLHPVGSGPWFACSDPVLERIWEVGRRTVSLCSFDAYIDCPTREQRAWTGDSVVHQLVDLTTSTDWTLARWHPQLAAVPRPDGMLPMAVAGDAEHSDIAVIPDWALHWIHSVHDLWAYTGDTELVQRLLPVAEGVLRWFEPFRGPDGLLTDVIGWVIIDWASVFTEGTSAALNGLYARALAEVAEMSDWLGDNGRGSWARHLHAGVRQGFELLWDGERGCYVDHAVGGERRRPVSQHAQAAAIVGRVAPADRHRRLVEVLTDEDRLVHATFSVPDGPAPPGSDAPVGGAYLRAGHPEPWWDVDTQVVRAQPFFRYVVHDALADAGRADLVTLGCRDWRWALERCPTSLTETWFGGTVSHGWSATPTRDLMQRTLGVRPAVAGFREAVVEPALGDLAWARGAVPCPAGLIEVDVTPERIVLSTPVPALVAGGRVGPGRHEITRR